MLVARPAERRRPKRRKRGAKAEIAILVQALTETRRTRLTQTGSDKAWKGSRRAWAGEKV